MNLPEMKIEDKRKVILSILHTTKEFYNLRELEKLAGKAGVTEKTVKDVLEQLTGDSLVTCEKIGTSNYYYSFPSAHVVKLLNRKKELTAEIAVSKKYINETKEELEVEKSKRVEGEEREELLIQIRGLTESETEWKAELKLLESCDPVELKRKEEETDVAIREANLWIGTICF